MLIRTKKQYRPLPGMRTQKIKGGKPMLYLGALFLAKVLDNALSTTKTILIQRSRWVLAGIAVILSDFLYFWILSLIHI